MANYMALWRQIILQPIYFYTKLKEQDWREEPLTFALITSWIIAFGGALVIFVDQYIPIGSTLLEKVPASRFVLIVPVLAVLAFIFFLITFIILGGVFVCAFFAALSLTAYVLHYTYLLLGGRGSVQRMIQSLLYSSAVFVVALLIMVLMILTKYAGMDFALFRAGYNFIYLMMMIYIYGLWAVAGRKVYGVPKWKAFVGALAPVLFLLIFGVVFDKIALPKLQSWIT